MGAICLDGVVALSSEIMATKRPKTARKSANKSAAKKKKPAKRKQRGKGKPFTKNDARAGVGKKGRSGPKTLKFKAECDRLAAELVLPKTAAEEPPQCKVADRGAQEREQCALHPGNHRAATASDTRSSSSCSSTPKAGIGPA